jgi:hypothetical protein
VIEVPAIFKYALILFMVSAGPDGREHVAGARYAVDFETLADCERVANNVLAVIDVPEGHSPHFACIPLELARPRS